jgi:hypothetical protein
MAGGDRIPEGVSLWEHASLARAEGAIATDAPSS